MYQYKCLNAIAQFGLNHFTGDYVQTEDAESADALLVRSASLHDMEFPQNLKTIARAGAGVNNIPLEKCAEQGIVVFNTPGANANGVKELVIAGMLLASRDVIGGVNWVQSERMNEEIAKVAEKQKKQFAGCELQGKKLGIIGLGAIGVLVANTAAHLGMEVLGYDPYISVEAAWNLSRNIEHITNVDEIYKQCDYITIHVPLLDSTRKMIDAAAIEKMKDGVVVLNYARDLLVDEDAMVDALKRGKVKRYMTDFPNHTVAGVKNAIVTPHLGASTVEAEENCARMAVKEVRCYLEHGNIKHSVNYPDCDMGIPSYPARVAICHKNVKNMLSQFTTILGGSNYNIVNMTNKSRGDYAYSMFDLEREVSPEIVRQIEAVEGVLRVRVICNG